MKYIKVALIVVVIVAVFVYAAYVGGQRGQYEADHLSWEEVSSND